MKKNILISVGSIAFVWLIWVVAYFCVANDYLLPSFWETFSAMGRLFSGAEFWVAFLNTLLRTLVSFAVSLLFGVALALVSALFGAVRAFLAPVISVLRTLPTMAVILVLLLWTNPSIAPVIVSVLVLFPAVYAAALASFDRTTERFGVVANVYNVSLKSKIFKMYLPLCAPSLFTQAGGILSLGIKITVSGEVLSSTYKSLGGLMQNAKMFVDIETLLALTLVTLLIGFLLEGGCYLLGKKVVRWKQ